MVQDVLPIPKRPGSDDRKLTARIRNLARAGDIVMFKRSYYAQRLTLQWVLGFLVGAGVASVLWWGIFFGISKAQAQAFIGVQKPVNVMITTGGPTPATLTLRKDGQLLWNGREIETDTELRAAVLELARKLQCFGRQ